MVSLVEPVLELLKVELPVVELSVEGLPTGMLVGVLVEPVREVPDPEPVGLPTVPVVSRVAIFTTSS